jgi:hypothetical protein
MAEEQQELALDMVDAEEADWMRRVGELRDTWRKISAVTVTIPEHIPAAAVSNNLRMLFVLNQLTSLEIK